MTDTFIVTKTFRAGQKHDRWTVSAYCVCGAAFRISSDSEAAADRAAAVFTAHHQGEGHGSTDSRGAYRARVRAYRAEEAQGSETP